MAMLAEPRRRQKLSFDPRNKAWSDDSSKFGQKLMEKMGWSQGKGLGANEDGNLSHVKVSLKNNTLGVGCKASQEDNWIAHQDDFNDLLSSLGQNHAPSPLTERSAQSLEERSKKSKSRVHYKKFVCGKDSSRYGKEGMNSILGRRLTQSAPVTPQSQSVENSDAENEKEAGDADKPSTSHSHGVVTVRSACSIGEYFAQKMGALRHTRKRQESESHSDTELDAPRCGFGFGPVNVQAAKDSGRSSWIVGDSSDSGSGQNGAGPSGLGSRSPEEAGKSPEDIPGPSGLRWRKGKKSLGEGDNGSDGLGTNDDGGNEGEEEPEQDSEEATDPHHHSCHGNKKKKKKKRKKKKAAMSAERGESDEEIQEPIEVRGRSENEEDEGIDVGRKKKKNKKKKRLVDEVMVMESRSGSASEPNGAAESRGERKKKKKTKKSRKDKSRRDGEPVVHSGSPEDDGDDTAETSEARSGGETCKRRKRDSSEEGLNEDGEETSSSRKKRKKARGDRDDEGEGAACSSIKKKKKQKM